MYAVDVGRGGGVQTFKNKCSYLDGVSLPNDCNITLEVTFDPCTNVIRVHEYGPFVVKHVI